MRGPNEEELNRRLKFSEQKRAHLKTLLAQRNSREDTFVWSLVDLMTLLLIFFIFMYSQHAGPIFSVPDAILPPPIENMEVKSQASGSNHGTFETDISSDSRKILNALTMDFPKKPKTVSETTTMEQIDKNEKITIDGSINELKQEALAALGESHGESFTIRWNQHRLVFVLGERVTFPVGQAKLLRTSQPTLKRIANMIASQKDFKVLVSGHTDNTPIDTHQFPSNWELSAARAISVAKALSQNGVDPLRLSIQGYAEYHPLHPNSTRANRQANRRVEITLIKQQSDKKEQNYAPASNQP